MTGKYQLLPPPASEEREALRSSIQKMGVLHETLVDEDGEIIDGFTRKEITDELGVPCPSRVMAGLSEDEKIGLALSMNLGRRNLTPEQKQTLVCDLHAKGWSVRTISEHTGISKSTVGRYCQADADESESDSPGVPPGTPEDIDAGDQSGSDSSGVPGGTPEPEPVTEPQTVKGRDGKTYQARQPRAQSKPKSEPSSGDQTPTEDDQEPADTEQTRSLKRRAFLWYWGSDLYVLLVANGQVVEGLHEPFKLSDRSLIDLNDRTVLGKWLTEERYDPYLKAWRVASKNSKTRIAEFIGALDGGGWLLRCKPWPHNDPNVSVHVPQVLDIVVMLLSVVPSSRRERLSKQIIAAVHPDTDERKPRPAEADDLSYLSDELLKLVGSTVDQETLWMLLREGWSVPREPPAQQR